MGASVSSGRRLSHTRSPTSNVHRRYAANRRSFDDDDSSGQLQPPCCFPGGGMLGKLFRDLSGSDGTDPIGTPLPATPQFERRRREQVKRAFQDDEERSMAVFRYGGMEQEVISNSGRVLLDLPVSVSSTGPNGKNAKKTNSTRNTPGPIKEAQVYEGQDAEQQLTQKYQLMEILGVGSTSTVHRCINRRTQEAFACKVIDCRLIEQRFRGMLAQFQTEIEALRKLQHPGIIRLYDVFINNDKIFIVMELMEGGELFDYVVKKGTLTEEEASKIVRKVTSALVYMHENQIVHRDLKPENLLLKRLPRSPNDEVDVKIIDFGLSKAMQEPVARTFLGTRGYLAPEMLQRRDYTQAVDSWALGVIVFVLLCGCLPFDDDSATVPSDDLVRAKFVLRFPRWAKNLGSSAKNLLSHLLDVNPLTRYSAEQALEHPWVRGDTASKSSLLSSPGRIRTSPGVSQAKETAARVAHVQARYEARIEPERIPPERRVVRKQSL